MVILKSSQKFKHSDLELLGCSVLVLVLVLVLYC